MPRQPRVWVPDGIYHVTVRGNNRQPIFLDAVDFQRYLIELLQCRAVLPHQLLAFALMPNHVHLLLRATAEISLSNVMHRLSTSYTRYFNQRHRRVGQLYQGRFYSNFVDRDSYLLEVSRYIHLNPVRARLVQRPTDYPWSSFRTYTGIDRNASSLIHCDTVLELFGRLPMERVKRYQQFVEELAMAEQEDWMRRLVRNRLIPPPRWLR